MTKGQADVFIARRILELEKKGFSSYEIKEELWNRLRVTIPYTTIESIIFPASDDYEETHRKNLESLKLFLTRKLKKGYSIKEILPDIIIDIRWFNYSERDIEEMIKTLEEKSI
jgi:hypothetical protein